MGLEHIRKSKRDFKKEWARGLGRTAVPDLFDPIFSDRRLFVSIELLQGEVVRIGELLSVDRCGEEIRVSRGLDKVAAVATPSSDLRQFLQDKHGNALGCVESVSMFGDMAELILK